jgi:hypothetical protein
MEVSGGLNIWHVYAGSSCRADYGDIRFSDQDGRELPCYLRPDHTTESARFSVRREGATSAGALTVHYGNPSARTTSDGPSVFLFFDDFHGSALDTTAWNAASSGTGATVDDGLTIYNSSDSTKGIFSKTTFDQAVRLEYLAAYNSLGWETHGGFIKAGQLANNNTYRESIRTRNSEGKYFFSVVGTSSHTCTAGPAFSTNARRFEIDRHGGNCLHYIDGTLYEVASHSYDPADSYPVAFIANGYSQTARIVIHYVIVRTYSTIQPSLLRTSRGTNPSYAGLARLPLDDVIRFGGVGSVQVLDDEIYSVAGAGGFSIETSVRSSILVAGTGALSPSLHLTPAMGFGGAGAAASEPVSFRTPIVAEGGVGSAYVAPAPIQFDMSKYKFESLIVSRSAQDALWKCDGKIDGLQAPLAYKAFDIKVPDHAGTLHTIFYGFVPGRDYVQAVAANKSIVQGYDAGFYLARQYLPDGDLSYPAAYNWPPSNLLRYWLGEESNQVGSHSRWEQVSGVMPYRIDDPTSWGHAYTPKDWVFQPKTSKMQAIQEVCEYTGMVFLAKWREINGRLVPCAYFVHQDDIDDPDHGLDLPAMATFTWPDPGIADEIRVTLRSDERYNRIIVRSSSPSGAWFEVIRETAALECGDELPIEYLEERGDLPEGADHAGWCAARADELYAYYTAHACTYTLTLIDRTDLELYQRCRFYGFGSIPDGEEMRIVSIRYVVRPTHTNVEITVTPDSRLSDLRRLQRSQSADTVSEMQAVAQSIADAIPACEIGTITAIDGSEAIVELERNANSIVRGRII